jgi:ABC-type oligopeptide transport system substrate-binding subunit
MRREHLWILILLALASLSLAACKSESTVAEAVAAEVRPAEVVHSEGAEPSRVTLTQEAAELIDIDTDVIGEMQVDGKMVRVIPYDAVLYDAAGDTWTYTNPEPLTFVRCHVTIQRVIDGHAVMVEGPALGSTVVVEGAAELFGSESEFEEE